MRKVPSISGYAEENQSNLVYNWINQSSCNRFITVDITKYITADSRYVKFGRQVKIFLQSHFKLNAFQLNLPL
jgi:hypothetical protein